MAKAVDMVVGAANPMGQVIALVAGTTSSMSWSAGPVARAGNSGWDLGVTCFDGLYFKKNLLHGTPENVFKYGNILL